MADGSSIEPLNVLGALTRLEVSKATELALEAGDFRLATLLSQSSGSPHVREYISQQLDMWKKWEVVGDRPDNSLIDEARLRRWVAALGWTKLLNNAGTSFRALPEADKAGLADAAQAEALAIALMLANPTLIKRPVIETGEALHVGFKPGDYAALFG